MVASTALAPEIPTLILPPTDRAPAQARHFLAEVFREHCLGDDYVGRIVISELVTNAHKHTDTEIIVARIIVGDGRPVIEVQDESDELPVVRPESETAESGRGLMLMSLLVEEWGVRVLGGGGKVAWARLAG